MSTTIKNVELVPQKDLDAVAQLDTALKSVSEQIIATAKAVEEIAKALGKQSQSTKETQKHIEKLNAVEKETKRLYDEKAKIMTKLDPAFRNLNKQNAGLRNEMTKQNQENRQMARLNNATRGSVEELRAKVALLTNEWANTARGTKEYRSALKELQKSQKELKKEEFSAGIFGRNVGNYPKIISGLTGIAARFVSIGAAIGVLKNATKTITDFEQANANLATVLGKSRNEITGLTESAKQLGISTEWSASKVTELQTELAKLGFNEQEIMSMQGSILQFATAMGAELAPAAEVAGAALRAFGLDASEIERVTGVMAVGADRSALSFSDFQSSMSTISPVARAFGFTIEDTVALLGTLSDAGFDASTAATATRNILLNLADANGKLAKQLGGPVKTIPELAKGLEALRDKGVSLAETLELTDQRSVAAFNTFMNGTDSLARLRGELDDTSGALETIQKEKLNTVKGSVLLLNSAWEGLMLSFSNSTGAMKTVVDGLTSIVNAINNVLNPDQAQERRNKDAYDSWVKNFTADLDAQIKAFESNGLSKERAVETMVDQWDKEAAKTKKLAEEFHKHWSFFSQKEYDALWATPGKQEEYRKRWEAAQQGYYSSQAQYEAYVTAMERAKGRLDKIDDDETGGPGLGTQLTEAELKALARNQKKMAQEEVKAQQNMANLIIEIRNAANQRIMNDSRKSYSERMSALEQFTADQKQLIHESAEYQVENLIQGLIDAENNGITTREQAQKAAEKQILYIREVAANQKAEIDKKSADTSVKIAEDSAKKIVDAVKLRVAMSAEAESEELKNLTKRFTKGLVTQEEYEDGRLAITRKYVEERVQAEMDAMRKQMALLPLDSERREQLALQVAEAEIDLNKWKNEQEEEDDKLSFDRRKEKIKEYIDFAGEMFSGLLDFATALMKAQTDRELAELEKRKEAAKERHDEETGRIERLEEAGAISTEQANARKAAADQKLREEEKKIEEEKAAAQTKQAKFDKAVNVVKVITSTAAAIIRAFSDAGPIAGIPLAAMIGALGAVQLATVLATPIPEYAEGTDFHKGGAAIVGDGGRPEMVMYGGSVYKTPDVPTLVDLPRGTQVLPDWDKAISAMAFNPIKTRTEDQARPVVNVDLNRLETLQKEGNTELAKFLTSYNKEKKNNRYYSVIGNQTNASRIN